IMFLFFFFFFSSRRRHTRSKRDWSSDVCSSDLGTNVLTVTAHDAVGNTSAASLTVTMFTFTDDPLMAQSMRIATAHFTELRAARSEERRVGKECRSRGGRGVGEEERENVGWKEE